MKNIIAVLYLFFTLLVASCSKKDVEEGAVPNLKGVKVVQQSVPLFKEFVGQVFGKADIPIRARVDGFLEKIHFDEGFEVKKGQLLYTIDDSPLREGQNREQSRLTEAKVNLVNAENDLSRIVPLAEINAISKRDLDAAMARRDAAQEAVKAAEANLNLANIKQGYARIYAPITGIIGKSNAKVGEYVGRAPNPVILNTVSQIDSILVEFFLTEKDYITFARQIMADEKLSVMNMDYNLELYLADDELFPYKGKVTFLDRNVDSGTGAILVQSIFPNPEKLLRPGQFAKVRGVVNLLQDALLVPQRAVFELQGFYNVFAVGEDGIVSQKRIEILDSFEDQFVIQAGLSKGEVVLMEGLMTVKTGQKVNIEKAANN